MRKFREVYKEALDNSIKYTVCYEKIQDEAEHRERARRRRRKKTVSAAAGFFVLLICGFTTVKAADYLYHVIHVADFGFQSSEGTTVSLQEQFQAGEEAGILEEWADKGNRSKADEVIIEEIEERTYSSYEAFKMQETFPLVVPEIPRGQAEEIHIWVTGENDALTFWKKVDDKEVIQDIWNFKNSEAHAGSRSYSDGATNERSYTTKAGRQYLIVDSEVEKPEGWRIHTAIVVGQYEIYGDYIGYTEEEVYKMLESMDLSPYE
ncbi:MAG: hypothetical protein NC412_07770 [Roseburia sp.]|nr:hypothetical protein [Roseburia sp.]MCM1278626.1 hypothetical protein [Robinsoniella sp.]